MKLTVIFAALSVALAQPAFAKKDRDDDHHFRGNGKGHGPHTRFDQPKPARCNASPSPGHRYSADPTRATLRLPA